MSERQLRDQFWANPSDTHALKVLADLWAERGEPRGEYVELCLLEKPTPQQLARRVSLETKSKGKLVGPARPFLREWTFGPNGLVASARCEAVKLAEGFDEIAQLNPVLMLEVTTMKKMSVISELATKAFSPLHWVLFANMKDKALVTLAPALRGCRHLAFYCRGFADECFTPTALTALADQLEGLESFELDFYRAEPTEHSPDRVRLPPLEAYEDVIARHPAFLDLRALSIEEGHRERFGALTKLVTFSASRRDRPLTGADLAAQKRSSAVE